MSYMKLAIVLAISTIATACGGHFPRGVSGNSTSSTATIATRIKPAVPTARFAIIDVRVFDGYKVQPPSTVFVDGDVISKELDTVDYVVEGQIKICHLLSVEADSNRQWRYSHAWLHGCTQPCRPNRAPRDLDQLGRNDILRHELLGL